MVTLAGTTTGLALLVAGGQHDDEQHRENRELEDRVARGIDELRQECTEEQQRLGVREADQQALEIQIGTVDIAYTLMVARAQATFDAARLRLLDGAAGVLLLLGGLALVMARRP